MDDLISRQAAIDSLHSKFVDGFDSDRWWNSMSVLYAINKVPSVSTEKTGRWIPVSERLPEIGQTVLISVKKYNYRKQNPKYHRKCDRFVYSVHIEKFTDLGCFQRYPLQVITAWMPLPQPYKGESEG